MTVVAGHAGRNAPCPCGSGRKAKRCHGAEAAATGAGTATAGALAILGADPENADALGLLGEVARLRGDIADAGELLTRAVAAGPADPRNRRRLAALLADLGGVDDAIFQLEQARLLATPDAGVEVDLAALLLGTGREPEARACADRARALDPGRIATVGPVRSVPAWCSATGDACRVIRRARTIPIARPRYAGDLLAPAPIDVMLPDAYVAEVRDATVIGGEGAVLARDGSVLLDIAAGPGAERFDLVRGALRQVAGGAALLDAACPGETIPRGVLFVGVASTNYYHWLLEHLTRLMTLEASADCRDWPLIVDERAVAVPQLIEALAAIGGADRDLVVLGAGTSVIVERLVVASPGAWLPIDLRDGLMLRPGDSIFDPDALEFLRERLLPPEVNPDVTGRHGTQRIHLARSRPGRLDGAGILGPVLDDFGFETILPENLSFAEQVRLFADADVILAESGAALTNLIFAPRSARIVVLGADRWDLTLFSGLAGALGQRLVYVAGRPISGSHRKAYQVRFTLDPAVLRRALTEVLA